MSIFLFANNASSTLASPINAGATSIALATGTGALFPSPISGEIFVATLADAATGLIREIIHVTNITGDTATVIRAQEGTTAVAWNAGDYFDNLWTAGSAEAMLQQGQVPQFTNYVVDTGGADTLTASLSPPPASLADVLGMPIYIKIAANNLTVGPTLNLNGFGSQLIVTWRPTGAASSYVGMLAAGQIAVLVWDGTYFQYEGNINLPGSAQANTPTVSTSGYQYLPNGMALQWGWIYDTSANDTETITFPVPFTAQPAVQVTMMEGTAAAASPIIIHVNLPSGSAPYSGVTIGGRVWSTGSASWVPLGTGGVANARFKFFWSALGPI